jgi:superfamily II DNA/RNA helicase
MHRTELAQLKKLKLRGTIVGVASDFLLPLSLKKLFSEVGIQKKIEVVDATRISKSSGVDPNDSDDENQLTKGKKNTKLPRPEEDASDEMNDLVKSAVSVLPKQLSQFEIRVPAEDKDIYLYYYLVQNPGRRIIVFVNSIKTCRRVDGLLRALGLACKPLHAELPQRTRLQNLDFLKSQPQAILIATDVAARGVDVDRIATVIHYDVARSPQVYIHRSGRTARNGQAGTTLSLVAPDDLAAHQAITKYLFSYQRVSPNSSTSMSSSSSVSSGVSVTKAPALITEKGMPTLVVQMLIIPALRERVLMARKIFSLSAQQSRASKEAHWAHQQAKEADLLAEGDDIDPDYEIERGEFNNVEDEDRDEDNEKESDGKMKPMSKQAKRELAIMKQELQTMLERPLGSLSGAMRSSTGLILHHQQYQQASSSSAPSNTRKHGKKARKAKSSATVQMAANDWRKRKNGFFVYAR